MMDKPIELSDETREILEQLEEEVKKLGPLADIQDIDIPVGISVQSTLKEIEKLSMVLYQVYNKNKSNPITINKIVDLIKLKTQLLGMLSVKPDMQEMIDSENNKYKKRVLEILDKILLDNPNAGYNITMNSLIDRLMEEGL